MSHLNKKHDDRLKYLTKDQRNDLIKSSIKDFDSPLDLSNEMESRLKENKSFMKTVILATVKKKGAEGISLNELGSTLKSMNLKDKVIFTNAISNLFQLFGFQSFISSPHHLKTIQMLCIRFIYTSSCIASLYLVGQRNFRIHSKECQIYTCG